MPAVNPASYENEKCERNRPREIDRSLRRIFQLSYVTRNRDSAVEYAVAKLGIENFFTFDGLAPVIYLGDPSGDIPLLRDKANLLAIFLGAAAIKDQLAAIGS